MSKADFLERVQLARRELNDAISGLTEDQISQDLVAGDWTVKDILAHLAAWQHETFLTIERAGAGDEAAPIITESVDEWNAARVAERRRLPLVDVIEEFHAAYDHLFAALENWPVERAPLGPAGWDETARLWWLTEHDMEHVEGIRAYRKRTS
ncbi:MAG: DinB family protein [Ktedonobacterales bacterium]